LKHDFCLLKPKVFLVQFCTRNFPFKFSGSTSTKFVSLERNSSEDSDIEPEPNLQHRVAKKRTFPDDDTN
jgi:hypothetical protein